MVSDTYGINLWKSIRNLWSKLRENSDKSEDGGKVLLREDKWLDQAPLMDTFNDIYTLNQQQRATVAEVWSNQGWNLSFRRPFNDREILRLVEFYSKLEQFKETSTDQDRLEWKGHSQGSFSVKGALKNLTLMIIKLRTGLGSLYGKSKLLIKFLVSLGLITLQLWEMFLSKKGLNWVMPRKIDQTLKIWSSYANLSDHKDRWKIIPACIWWAAWIERNLRCHQNKSNNIQKMKMKCLVLFHFWCKQEYREDLESSMDVLGSL
ncbi:hypothetical protein H5410_059372 [Solanum commersonii]|uniref:Uncharacterized protein n=1 Tax=Solanum commersonii TaxID=4109 RepID=A0A9J5W388_SOLCO|nr:hypothetical protein H5410_059372 [Solanum commersonii]